MLITACLSTFLVNLDNTIVNVALPDIRAHLHPSVAGLQWILDSYLLTLTSLLILSGSLGDRFGRKLIFQCGLYSFALGSLLSSLAPTAGWLVAFRVLQAVGASMLNPVGLSIVGTVFAEPQERAKAFGTWGGAVGLGMASGPLLGGVLVQAFGWRSVFWACIPVALAGAVCARLFVPESKAATYRKPDLLGQVLVFVALVSVVFVIIEVSHLGVSSAPITGGLVLAISSLVSLWYVERSREDPLLNFQFFRSVPFSASMVIAVLNYAAIAGFLFINTLYLQDIRGYSPMRAGLYTLPTALGTSIGAQISGRLVRAKGVRVALVAAGAAITVGTGLVAAGIDHGGSGLLLTGYLVLGLGFGAANTPVNNTAMAGMPRSQAGVAGAIASASRQLGQTLGVAVFGALVGTGLADMSADFAHSSAVGWYVIAGIGLAIIVCGVIASRPAALQSAQRIAAQFQET